MKKGLSLLMSCVLCFNVATGCGKSGENTTDGSGLKIYLTVSQYNTFKTSLVNEAKTEAERLGAQIVARECRRCA